MALSDGFLQELRLKNEIDDIISQYVILKRHGNTSKGLCPFHNEKTPSFTVYHDTQSFYCFGCGVGGDVITFVRQIENLDYIDAVKKLAERAGMQMPNEGYDDSLSKHRLRILEANRAAARFFHQCLLSDTGRPALEYYKNRGLSMQTIQHFGLGYAPDSWNALLEHLRGKGFRPDEMLGANLVRKGQHNYYDNFRNRVITPIIDLRGNVIAFGGRVLDDSKPKYINTSDTIVYKKTHALFGLNFAKDAKSDTLILCEGYMDVIALHQAGFPNAIASCGTALTAEQVKIISRYCKKVVLSYDADEAGQKAVQKAIQLFSATDLTVKVPALKGGKDPDEIIKKFGAERFKGMLEAARNDIEFTLAKAKQKYDLNSDQGKIDFLKEAIRILSRLSPIEQDIYTSKLAEELNVNRNSIEVQLEEYVQSGRKKEKRKQFAAMITEQKAFDPKFNPTGRTNLKLAKAQERLIALLLFHPDFYQTKQNFLEQMIDSPFYKKAFHVIGERLEQERAVDLTALSAEFTPEEIGHLAYIQSTGNNLTNAAEEYEDCIKTIQEEYNKSNQSNPMDLSDDAFRSLFQKS